jgi:putative ABC transport system permease protein
VGSVARRKVLRDLWLARGRTAVLVFAMAVSLTTVGAILGAYGVLAREMPRSFLSSHPASATLVMHDGVDPGLLEAVRRRPGIADAERRGMVFARVEVAPDTWLPLRLFVVEDFDAMRIETVTPVEGAWPPPAGALLLERTSRDLLSTRVGASMMVSPEGGRVRPLQVAGVVFDAGVAPAWQEQTALGYVTPATLSWLGSSADLDLLKVAFRDDALDASANERTGQDLSTWLAQQGVVVEEIRIPPPGQHPHQGLMNALALVLLLFGLLALALSGLLVGTMVSAMLARHVRQIGAMKAIGAQPSQVGLMYAAMVVAIGAAAVALALIPSVVAGRALAGYEADLSNVELASRAFPWSVYGVVALAGLLTPLLAAAGPVVGASRMTIREAISEVGMYQGPSAGSGGALAARLVGVLGPTLILALRQAVRRRGRLIFSLILLATGGGIFMSGLNVAAASEQQLASGVATLGYDLELSLGQPQPAETLLRLVRAVPGVAYAEAVGFSNVAPARPGEVPVARTHKDGGHGTQRLYGLAPDSRFRPAVESGRWLEPGDLDAIVVAPGELERLGTTLGGPVSLSLDGRTTSWRVVGVMPVSRVPFGGAAGLYVSDAGFDRATGRPVGSTQVVRIITAEHHQAAQKSTLRVLEGILAAEGIGVTGVIEADWLAAVIRGHMAIVQGGLQSLGIVLGVVGALTLASTMSLSVVERTREFGVMQTIGATPARVIWVVVAEALFIGASSWLAAVPLALLLSSLVGTAVGAAIFGAPLPLVLSPVALLAWLAVALLGSAAAGALPARAASRLTIRETLAYA